MDKKRIILLLTVFGLLSVAVILFVNYLFTPTHPITKEQAYALIAREVPVGASRIEIENWIDSKGWGNRCGYTAKSSGTDFDGVKGGLEDLAGNVGCYIEDNTRTLDSSGDLVLVFYLNKEGKMVGYYCIQYSNSM